MCGEKFISFYFYTPPPVCVRSVHVCVCAHVCVWQTEVGVWNHPHLSSTLFH